MRFRKLIFVIASAVLLAYGQGAFAQKLDRGLSLASMPAFTEKGDWMIGGTASWAYHDNDNFKFLIADGVTTTGYSVVVSPAVCYMFRDNMGAGVRVGYQRGMLKVDEAGIGFGDLGIDISDFHTLKETYDIQGILRNYIPIGTSKRLALYNEIQLAYKFGAQKVVSGVEDWYDGSYGKIRNIGLNFCPGIVAFANDHLAVDVNVNMLGLSYGQNGQIHNQTDHAERSITSMNFKINILAIGFGLYYYL